MKKLLILSLAALTAGTFSIGNSIPKTVSAEETALDPACKSAYLCDYESGTEVYAKNETKRLPIASMCKIMTLLLSFEAVDRGELSYDEMITVSENASGMGGSQIFLGANLSYRADELMKSVAVCSANDSCVALAERVGGTEEAFIARMNERAKELGAENTLFANCTGLPKEPQYSCAKDVSVMLRELLKHQKYYEFSKVWLEDFAHPDGRTTQMTNTNKLIRYYDGCDGGKTGFTNEAGFCLAATAKRNDTRLISVVIGSESSKTRNATISKLFDYAFNCYESKKLLERGQEIELRASVRGSKTCEIPVIVEDTLSVFGKKGANGNVSIDYTLNEGLKAPVQLGDEVGTAVVYVDGVETCKTRLLAGESAERFSWWDAYRESAQKWN
ncbi:MAG: D-alanyl-D-alanine carboxypeptidase [Clostridia bacterium]|nr:D-alanyl-D-alanine carboxypeptidase [Clostridia bacterium]